MHTPSPIFCFICFAVKKITANKLYGAVAAYAIIAIFWAYLYGVIQYFCHGSLAYRGTPKNLGIAELIFYSFTELTTARFVDITAGLSRADF
jgi:hypothetical protein